MFLHDRWGTKTSPELERFSRFARLAFAALDWLPVRFTAAAFAVVGDFEDAVYCWRTQAANWPDPALGIVLASGAGAIGVRLGMPILAEEKSSTGRSWVWAMRPIPDTWTARSAWFGARWWFGCSCCC